MIKFLNNLLFSKKYEIVRYTAAGFVSVFVNFGVYTLLYHGLSWDLTISNFLAISASILISFLLNRLFVFRTQHNKKAKTKQEFIKFLFFRLLSLAMEMLGVELLVGTFHWPSLIGKGITLVIVIGFNFLMNIFFVFPDGCSWVKDLLGKIFGFILKPFTGRKR